MKIYINRYETSNHGTFGFCFDARGNEICKTLELPWRGNKQGKSCIPAGEYECVFLKKTASGKFRNCYWVLNVPKRIGILIHPANFAGNTDAGYRSQLLGCIAPGMHEHHFSGQKGVMQSRHSMRLIHTLTGKKEFKLIISWL